jgi:3-oxoacyl-[acyl-carrier protein] reductase
MADPRRAALVTGASRGIGRAVAQALADDGFQVVVHHLTGEAEAHALADEITAGGGAARAVRADVSRPEECRRLVESALAAFGRIDVLVNNAGISQTGVRLADLPPADWERMLRVNLSGPFHLIQAALPHMRQRRSGHIVNLSSNVTQRFPATYGAYTVSKVGVDAMTRVLAKEEGPNGIRVNAIAPGPIATDMFARALDLMGPERGTAFVQSIPLGRVGQPEEIAAAVRFLLSDGASYLTGQIIYVNGGGPA